MDDFGKLAYYVEIYNNRGLKKLGLKDYEGAIQDFTEAIRLDPYSDENLYYNRGLAKEELKDHEGAYKDYSKAKEILEYK